MHGGQALHYFHDVSIYDRCKKLQAGQIKGGITIVKKGARHTLLTLSCMNMKVPEIDNEGK